MKAVNSSVVSYTLCGNYLDFSLSFDVAPRLITVINNRCLAEVFILLKPFHIFPPLQPQL